MSDSEIYKELGALTKDKGKWEENMTYVSSLLSHESGKIKAKALWLLGEMGLLHPMQVKDAVPRLRRERLRGLSAWRSIISCSALRRSWVTARFTREERLST